ncbi:paramyosin [Rhypophila decipiens]
MDRQYLRPRMTGAGSVVSDDRYGSRASEWPESDRERDSMRSQPVKSILRKPLKLQTRPRRNSDSSVTSNLPVAGSDSELAGPSTPPLTSSTGSILPRKVLKAKFPGATVPEERRGVVNLRSSRASASSIQSGYHVPPVRTVLSPSYPPDNRQLDRHDRRISRERNDRHGYSDREPDTESISESSELSTTTQATTVTSALSDFEGSDVTPTEAPTTRSSVRFTPSVIGSVSSVNSSPPPRKVKPRMGTRVRAPSETERAAPPKLSSRSVNTKLLPPSPATSGELKMDKTQTHPDRSLVHKIEQLEAEARGLRVSQARLERELQDNSSAVSSSGKEKEAAVKERDQERADKAELIHLLQEQTAVVDEYKSNLELQKGFLDELEKERDAERAAKEALQAQLDANKKLLDEFSCNFELQKVMLKEAEKERDEIKEAKDQSDAKYAVLQDDLKTFRQERKAQEDEFIGQVVTLTLIKESLETASDNKNREIVDLSAERDKLKEEVAALSGQIAAMTDDMNAKEEAAHKAQAAAEEEQQALQAKIEHLQKAKDELDGDKAALQGEKSELQTQLDTAQGGITSLNARIQELEASATDFDAKMTGKEEEITTLQAETADLKSRIDGLESDKADLQKQIEELEAEKTKTQAELHNLETDLAGSKAANVSIATSKLELSEDLSYARADIEKLSGEKATLQAEADKVPDLEAAKTELEGKISELEAKVGELEAKILALQAEADKIPGLSSEKDEVFSKAAELESKISGLEAKIGELQPEADKVPSLAEAKSSLEAQLAELQAKMSTLQAELDKDPDTVVAALKAELEANKQEIARRVEELSALTESNSSLSTQLGATQQQLTAVQSSLDTVNASYTTATEQVIELQAKVEQLSSLSGGLRSRRGSRSRNSSPQKKEGRDKKDKQMVVVRNPADRGAMALMLQIVGNI